MKERIRSLLHRQRISPRLETVCLAAIAILSLVLLALRVLSHSPFFDETLHVRYTWLLSKGMKPEADYFCQYPALVYIVVAPYLRLFADSAYLVLALRALSVVIFCLVGLIFYRHGRTTVGSGAAGLLPFLLVVSASDTGAFFAEYSIDHFAALAAIWAMTLLFRPCRPIDLAIISGCALLSVAITPKYVLPLFFGLLGYYAAALYAADWRGRGRLTAAAVIGGLAALVLIVLIHWVAKVSLLDNLRYAHVLNSKFNLAQKSRGFQVPLGMIVWTFVTQHWLVTIVLLAGLTCWARRAVREGLPASLPGAGIIFGMAAFTFAIYKHLCFEQYMTPMLISTALFAPYAFPARTVGAWWKRPRAILMAAVGLAVCWQFWSVSGDFRRTPWNMKSSVSGASLIGPLVMGPPLLKVLRFYNSCLKYIPEDEKVVAVGRYHPLFRRDLTWVGNDDTLGFAQYMEPGDPARKAFATDLFREALQQHPPAYICLADLSGNYPPDWWAVCVGFLRSHESSYVSLPIDSKGNSIYLRRDLVGDRDAAESRFKNTMELTTIAKEDAEAATFLGRGNQLAGEGKNEEAIAEYLKALTIDPYNPLIHANFGTALARVGRSDEAKDHYQKALDTTPPGNSLRTQVHINLSEVLGSKGNVPLALEHLRTALELATVQNDKAAIDDITARIKRWESSLPPGRTP